MSYFLYFELSPLMSMPSMISLDLLSASRTGYGTLWIELMITHFIAVSNVIFVPTETNTGFVALLPFRSPAPQILPLSPFKRAKSFYFFIYWSQSFFTWSFPSPSIKNSVLPTPSAGTSMRTPKWQANPHWFECKIPLPSMMTNSGHASGFLAFNLLNI